MVQGSSSGWEVESSMIQNVPEQDTNVQNAADAESLVQHM